MFVSKTKAAIANFKRLEATLDLSRTDPDYNWLNQLADLVSKYIGPDSNQYKGLTLKKNMFDHILSFSPVWEYDSRSREHKYRPENCKRLIEDYIYYIETNGVYVDKSAANNFMGTLSNEALIGIVTTIVSAVGVACYQIGLNNGKSEQALNSAAPKNDTIFIEKAAISLPERTNDTSNRMTLPKVK
jgi:hypothetical protein